MEHTIILELGDSSGDGHGKSDRYTFKCNLNTTDLVGAYQIAASAHKLDITEECTGYECNTLRQQFIATFNDVFANSPNVLKLIQDSGWGPGKIDAAEHAEIYLQIAKLAHPELMWVPFDSREQIIDIGGYGYYWD
jgi:hypothetical protein